MMKNKTRKWTVTMVLVLVMLFGLAALPVAAAPLRSEQSFAERNQRLEQRQHKLDLRIALLKNQIELLQQVKNNTQLRLELRDLLHEAQDTLDPDIIEELKELHSQLRTVVDTLRESRWKIRQILDDLRTPGQRPTLEAIEVARESIEAVQAQRLTSLTEMNGLLQQMIDLLES